MNNCEPMAHRKKSREGQAERLSLLRKFFPAIEDHKLRRPVHVGVDDLLDAAAAAWSALRIYDGVAQGVRQRPSRESDEFHGFPMTISIRARRLLAQIDACQTRKPDVHAINDGNVEITPEVYYTCLKVSTFSRSTATCFSRLSAILRTSSRIFPLFDWMVSVHIFMLVKRPASFSTAKIAVSMSSQLPSTSSRFFC